MNSQQTGQLVVVVGPSGAGKDSIIKAAQTHFKSNPRIDFARRTITRECDPSAEVHHSVTEEQFKRQQSHGDFSVWWHANGLYYGLPASIHTDIDNGQVVVANGSRAALDNIRTRFSLLTTVHVTASHEALALRLGKRNRENAEQIKQRLQRNQSIAPLIGDGIVTIDNSGERQCAIDQFIALLDSF